MGIVSLLHFNSDDSDPEQRLRWINIGPVPSPKKDDPCGELPVNSNNKFQVNNEKGYIESNMYMHYFVHYKLAPLNNAFTKHMMTLTQCQEQKAYITLHSNYVVTITNFKADPKQTQTPNEFHLENNSVSAVTETLIKLCVFWMSSTTSIPFYIQIFTQRPHQNAGIPIDCIRHLHLLHSTTCHTQFPTLCWCRPPLYQRLVWILQQV